MIGSFQEIKKEHFRLSMYRKAYSRGGPLFWTLRSWLSSLKLLLFIFFFFWILSKAIQKKKEKE